MYRAEENFTPPRLLSSHGMRNDERKRGNIRRLDERDETKLGDFRRLDERDERK